MPRTIKKDIEAIFERDPAARNVLKFSVIPVCMLCGYIV